MAPERTLSGVGIDDGLKKALDDSGRELKKVKKKKEKQRVQIKCPVGSPTSFFVPRKVTVNEENARMTFHMFDRKHVGFFTHRDVRRVFADSENGQIEFLARFDANNDGKVEWDEFLDTMNEFIDEKGDLNFLERVYITFSEPDSSKLAKGISIIIMILILVSTMSFVMDSIPHFHSFEYVAPGQLCPKASVMFPSKMDEKPCGAEYMMSHNPTMEPTMAPTWGGSKMPTSSVDDDWIGAETCACPPTKHYVFEYIEIVCITVFSIEYMARFLTAWAARFGEKFEIILDVVTMPMPQNPALTRTYTYLTNKMNLIDFFAIIPFYIDMMPIGAGVPLGFLRVLRLARVFRVFKMGKYSKGMSLLTNVLMLSAPALKLLCFFSLIGMILFGSMIFFCEQGEWMVTADYPDGAYLRRDVTGTAFEPSPFVSIPTCFWWVIVTQTTVGYGDMYPVTDPGKAVGSICMVSGILVLALPITIIGANFSNEYGRVQSEEKREAMELAAELAEDAARAEVEKAIKEAEEKKSRRNGKPAPLGRAPSFTFGMGKAMGLGGKSSARVADDGGEGSTAVTSFEPDVPSRKTMFESSPPSAVDESDSEDEDEDVIRMTKVHSDMNRKSSDLQLMIRDYLDEAKLSQRASTAMLDEVNEVLDLLNEEETIHIDSEKVMAMVNMLWYWLRKCDADPAVVTNKRTRELLLKATLDFASSTVGLDMPR
mmetsp:Transcript_32542/g.85748  ORF Transcript_32542/g.85748 Transcript_32542/m.85748 type:complete len:712 (-) Transcript_32542:189-2324(-)|eukprot:CAMPEP_0119522864 /NCGR_PEP_ID=MMETSP1344-20130328/38023_1 /TAXON_ID=236787 /ORGANISM="Florenciella parvula, Strain CCMP2471" /LENGTH=711 /DNA_ID=CAMNT_0007560929 /DNA_START=355 /DNA_END=2490 /DNA_ORIENTATION=+